MLSIMLQQVSFQVAEGQAMDKDGKPKPVKLLLFTDPTSGIKVEVPMEEEVARRLGGNLLGSGLLAVPPKTVVQG